MYDYFLFLILKIMSHIKSKIKTIIKSFLLVKYVLIFSYIIFKRKYKWKIQIFTHNKFFHVIKKRKWN